MHSYSSCFPKSTLLTSLGASDIGMFLEFHPILSRFWLVGIMPFQVFGTHGLMSYGFQILIITIYDMF